jgi:hypothetical protein
LPDVSIAVVDYWLLASALFFFRFSSLHVFSISPPRPSFAANWVHLRYSCT